MIVFDFEWNRGYDKTPLDEILQIGAVRVDRLGGPVTDSFNVYIRPVVHKRFDPGAKKLPELQTSLEEGVDFPAAMEAFRRWCGEEQVFAAWGNDDFKTLTQNCAYWKVPPLTPGETYDLQRAFSHRVGTRQQMALWRAVEYCGIPDLFVFHNALYDAFYTSAVAEWLTPEMLTAAPAQDGPRFCTDPFPPQPRRKIGPLAAPEEILNARNARRTACPLCGRKVWIPRWNISPPQQCYAAFTCREHGRFLCRLTLVPLEDGRWNGRLTVPAITPVLLQEYQRALKSGVLHACKGSGGKKRRGRRRQSARKP